jgi:hypothetical protein
MSLSDSFKAHGAVAITYNMQHVIAALRAVIHTLKDAGERPVTGLAVAGLLVQMHAEVSGTTVDETIELMRVFIETNSSAAGRVTP